MIIARSNWQLRRALDTSVIKATHGPITDVVRERPRTAFIPTMGALHEGHISLVKAAQEDGNPITVVSIFVNPSQFSAGEDFDQYPRTEEKDLELLEEAGVDIAFLPTVDDIYPASFGTELKADPRLTSCLCGESRGPEHFNGVVTVVARLFGLVQPDTAWFGEKDWQQLQVIRRMAQDIHPCVEVIGAPTIRTEDGLALSSRNSYLSPEDREVALAVPQTIAVVRKSLNDGATVKAALEAGREVLGQAGFDIDYLEVRSAVDLSLQSEVDSTAADSNNHPRIFLAAKLGAVRLIDNDAVFTPVNDNPKMAMTSA